MAKILVSYPVLGRPNMRSMQSLYSAINSCKEHDVVIHSSENDSMISRVRNVHISTFINDYPECDYFVSIDSDLEIVNRFWNNNIFTKLVSHGAKFVGGLYSLKKDGESISSSVPMDRNQKPDFDSGLIPMLWLSTGCWCLHRSAIEKMIDTYPDLTYDGDDNMSNKKIFGLYIPMLKTLHLKDKRVTKYLSEDWSFCERWRELGGQIFADTSIVLKHYGEKPFNLWETEVVVQRKDTAEKEEITAEKEDITPERFENKDPEGDQCISIPDPGFDLEEK